MLGTIRPKSNLSTKRSPVLFSLVQDVANKTNEAAGDGTTTATVLSRAIFAEGVRNVAAGCNPMDLRRGSQAAVDHVIKFMESKKRSITTKEEISQVRARPC